MFRKLILPAACAALLSGCVSYGYSDGGYYYGQPSVRYYGGASYGYGYPYSRYYGGRYGYGYPYGYGGLYGSGYGYGYGYGGGYYGYPYYPNYPYRPRPPHRPPHDDDGDGHDGDGHDGDGGKPPWRRNWSTGGDAQRLRDNIQRQNGMRMSTPSQREAAVQRQAPRMEMPTRQVERRAMPGRRMSAPAPRNNVRERDIGREQEP